jgi:hypothetical protein
MTLTAQLAVVLVLVWKAVALSAAVAACLARLALPVPVSATERPGLHPSPAGQAGPKS